MSTPALGSQFSVWKQPQGIIQNAEQGCGNSCSSGRHGCCGWDGSLSQRGRFSPRLQGRAHLLRAARVTELLVQAPKIALKGLLPPKQPPAGSFLSFPAEDFNFPPTNLALLAQEKYARTNTAQSRTETVVLDLRGKCVPGQHFGYSVSICSLLHTFEVSQCMRQGSSVSLLTTQLSCMRGKASSSQDEGSHRSCVPRQLSLNSVTAPLDSVP